MKKRWAVLIVFGGLLLGILIPRAFFAGATTRQVHTMLSCLILDEAEKAGFLDKAKRATLVDDLTHGNALDPGARQSAATLKTGCPTYP